MNTPNTRIRRSGIRPERPKMAPLRKGVQKVTPLLAPSDPGGTQNRPLRFWRYPKSTPQILEVPKIDPSDPEIGPDDPEMTPK